MVPLQAINAHQLLPGRKTESLATKPESSCVPNFFLMTFRIFFWSNFLGSPCTVVRVLRPFRSGECVSPRRPGSYTIFEPWHTLDPNMDVVLRLLGLPCVFVGFGEGVCCKSTTSAICHHASLLQDSLDSPRGVGALRRELR